MRRAALAVVLVTALVVASSTSAVAQVRPRATFGAGGSIVGPLSGTADNFKTGFGLGAGALAPINEQMAIQVDYLYARLDGKAQPSLPSGFDSSMTLQYGTADFVFRAPPAQVRLYVLAGGGLYHRAVKVTAHPPENVCNPWWFVCSSSEPVRSVEGTHSSTDFGVNVGAGFSAGRFFAEARYHYVFGPTYSTPSGSQPATGKFILLTIGARF